MNNPERTQLAKTPISKVLIFAALLLMVLPFVSAFNSFLTDFFLKWKFYQVLQDLVVPYEAKVFAGSLNLLGFSASAVSSGVWVGGSFFAIEWNCLGWQSAVFLLVSFLGGIQGKFSWASRFEVVVIGLLGTYLVNIIRLILVGVLALTINNTVAIFFHDYLALILVILWFVFFWWFSYSYVLEERE